MIQAQICILQPKNYDTIFTEKAASLFMTKFQAGTFGKLSPSKKL
jgi:hypothetical protein